MPDQIVETHTHTHTHTRPDVSSYDKYIGSCIVVQKGNVPMTRLRQVVRINNGAKRYGVLEYDKELLNYG
jgi:hypothetical protein